MKKQQFIIEVKKVNFSELNKLNPKLEKAFSDFTNMVSPQIISPDGSSDYEPHEGEFPQEVQDGMGLFFEQLPKEYPGAFSKSPLQKKIDAFEIALEIADNDKDMEILRKKIAAFKIALELESI